MFVLISNICRSWRACGLQDVDLDHCKLHVIPGRSFQRPFRRRIRRQVGLRAIGHHRKDVDDAARLAWCPAACRAVCEARRVHESIHVTKALEGCVYEARSHSRRRQPSQTNNPCRWSGVSQQTLRLFPRRPLRPGQVPPLARAFWRWPARGLTCRR
jgi:hypothetical protein